MTSPVPKKQSASALSGPTDACYQAFQDGLSGLLFRHPFYYYYISQTTYHEVPAETHDEFPVAAVGFDISKGLFRLLLNRGLFPKILPSVTGGMFILAHEVHHIILSHCTQEGKFTKHELWPIAIDLTVNSTLVKDGLKMPHHPDKPNEIYGVTIEKMVAAIEEEWKLLGIPKTLQPPAPCLPAEEYLIWMVENQPPRPKQGGGGKGQGQGQGSEDGDDEGDGQGQQDPNGNQGGKQKQNQGQGGQDQDQDDRTPLQKLLDEAKHEMPDLAPDEREIVKQMVAERAKQAAAQASPPGSIAGMVEQLIRSLKPQIPWGRQMSRWIGMQGGIEVKTSYARENKYFNVPTVLLRPTKKILFACDSSGSVGDDEIAQGMGEVEGIKKLGVDVDLMWVDWSVHEVKPFKVEKNGYRAKGRGGTDMRRVFEWIKANKKHYDAVIIFTDLETPFPSRTDRMGIRTLWVGTRNHPVPPEAGEVIYLPSNHR